MLYKPLAFQAFRPVVGQEIETQATIAQTTQPAENLITGDLVGLAQLYPELFPWWMSAFAVAYLLKAIADLFNGKDDDD